MLSGTGDEAKEEAVETMVFLLEVTSVLLFVAVAGSQVVWPWMNGQPLFPDLRPAVRRRRRMEAALRAAERELAEISRRESAGEKR